MASVRTYRLYGLRLRSDWRLPLPGTAAARPDVRLCRAPATEFVEHRRSLGEVRTFGLVRSGDELYLRWEGLAEFVVADRGRQVRGRPLARGWAEAFRAYLLTQVLSFAMLEAGREHLHATAVAIGGRAVAFTAQPGTGKSTLAAAFVAAGDRLLTDDVLPIRCRAGGLVVESGYPRMRLSRQAAARLLPAALERAAPHPVSDKLVVPVPRSAWDPRPASLARIYVLSPGARSIRLRPISGAEAFRVLAENTYNAVVTDPQRLRRHMAFTTSIASEVPLARLSFPPGLDRLGEVRERVLEDLSA